MKAVTWSEKGPKSVVNEDACVAIPTQGLFAVADGVGGGPAGEYASRAVIEYICDQITLAEKPSVEKIESSIKLANKGIHSTSKRKGILGVASTLALAWVEKGKLTCFHVGDSRIYRLREGALAQLTEDHTAAVVRAKKGIKNVVTRAMGAKDTVEVEVSEWHWQQGDVVMITSDGITDVLEHGEMANILVSQEMTMAEKARKLAEVSGSRGGRDDKTVVIAF